MLKKILSLTLAIMILLGIFTLAVSAAKVGEPLGDVLYSDITAYINGSTIPTSIKSGTTMVVVEDLAKYGFDVVWNGKDKTLKVEINADKKVTPIAVEENIMPVGTVKTKYVSTDIKTYLSGELVESFAIDGRTLIDFELLSMYGKLARDENARTISLTTDPGKTVPSNNTGAADDSLTGGIFKVFGSGVYHIKMGISAVDTDEIIYDMYMKNGRIAIKTEMEGMAIRVIIDGDKMYMIMDGLKMIMTADVSEFEEEFGPLTGTMNVSDMIYSDSGVSVFGGGKYGYEEYKTSGGSAITQYFIDKGTFKGIRVITEDATVDMEILEFDTNVPDSVFEIPSDYEMF